MNRLIHLCIIAYIVSNNIYSQQNLFNIPSGDLTPAGKWFYQKQTNFYQPWEFEIKNHFVVGLGKDFELGLNLINLPVDFKSSPIMPFNLNPNTTRSSLSPLVMFTAQKKFNFTEDFGFSVGTQMGFNITNNASFMRFAHFNYGLFVWNPFKGLKLISGLYVTNRYKAGEGSTVGYLGGFELHLNKKWILMGDFISGTHSLGCAVMGVTHNVSKRFQICLGGLIPNPGSLNKPALVLEINILGFDSDESHPKHH